MRGYTLGSIDIEQLNGCLRAIISGQAGIIWSSVNPIKLHHENWKLFVHPVSGSNVDRHVIEIRVMECPGGMFCAMPLCYEVSHSGDIIPLKGFEKWKEIMLLAYKHESVEDGKSLEDHFTEGGVKEEDLSSEVEHPLKPLSTRQCDVDATLQDRDPQSSSVHQWWLASDDTVTNESLCFDHCCARELADDSMDIHKPFSFFPSVQTVMERNQITTDITSTLAAIEKKYTSKDKAGVGVIIGKMVEHLGGDLRNVLPSHHVCDVIVLKSDSRPSVITVLSNDSEKAASEHYSRTLVRLLKRFCLLTYRHLCRSGTYLCFQRLLYCNVSEFDTVQENINYPREYSEPTPRTLNIVRYTLAGFLLHCEPLTDRFGDIMVRHLSSKQTKILMGKRPKVMVIEGKAGSGKTVLALEAMRRIDQKNKFQHVQSKIVFLCRGRGLAAYVKYQTKEMGIHVDIKAMWPENIHEINEDYFNQYTHIFIDDAHSIPLTGEPNCRDMYKSLLSSLRRPNSYSCILLDPEMQDYRGCIPTDFSQEIKNMARAYYFLKQQDVETHTIETILRNSTRICKYMCTKLDEKRDKLRTIRNLPEDGVYLHNIEDLHETKELLQRGEKDSTEDVDDDQKNEEEEWKERKQKEEDENEHEEEQEEEDEKGKEKDDYRTDVDAEFWGDYGDSTEGEEEDALEKPTLVSRLRDVLKYGMYQERHITILTENTTDKTLIQEILSYAKYPIQDGTSFLGNHITVDTLENFEGLESRVILFIVPKSWGTKYVGTPKYNLCISSRAISRLEFLIPWDSTRREKELAELRRDFETKVSPVTTD